MLEIVINATTDGSGDAVVTVPLSSQPRALYGVEWKVGTLVSGVDATLKAVNTASAVDQTLLALVNANSNAWYYPRTLEDDEAGAALTTRNYLIVNGDLQLTIAQGGASKAGAMVVYLME